MKREATLGNLLNQTFAEIGEHAKIIGLYVAVMIPVAALSNFMDGSEQVGFGLTIDQGLPEQGAIAVMVVLAAFVINVLLTYWLYASLVRQTPRPGFDRFWPWLGIYILASLATILGLILLIVPGLILLTRWVITLPLVIRGDTRAMDTFGASWEATRGRGWSIFGAVVILVLAIMVVLGVGAGITAAIFGASSIASSVIAGAAEAIATAILIAFSVGAYRLLRDNPEEAAAVFA